MKNKLFKALSLCLLLSLLAGLAVGIYKDLNETASGWHVADSFKPHMKDARRDELLTGWHRAVDGALHWAEMNR